jgi:hypothetical protein
MAARILWQLNLDAELELRHLRAYTPARAVAARMPELVPRLSSLIAPHDVVLGRDDDLSGWVVALAFCPTPSALAALARVGARPPHVPDLSLLRELGRRAFSAELGQCLPGARYVRSELELVDHFTGAAPGDWLIKRDFSFAGRERLRVSGGLDRPGTRAFAARAFERGEGLQLEPWCERLLDVSIHGYLLPGGRLYAGAPRVQRCDERGTWQASEPGAAHLTVHEHAALTAELTHTAEALAARGFVGPFGIDGFRYRSPSGEAFCARCEVNPRFTMGYPRALVSEALGLQDSSP